MRKEYDFTNAKQGKFYRPIEELEIPIYLDNKVKEFLLDKIKNSNNKNLTLSSMVNLLLKNDIEIAKQLN